MVLYFKTKVLSNLPMLDFFFFFYLRVLGIKFCVTHAENWPNSLGRKSNMLHFLAHLLKKKKRLSDIKESFSIICPPKASFPNTS